MLLIISYILMQSILTLSNFAQIINYIFLVINCIYTIVMTVFIVPTWREHKLNTKDYNDRNSPAALRLKIIEEERIEKQSKDIADIKHTLNNLTNQLTIAIKRKEDEPDWQEFMDIVNKLNNKLL